MRKIVCVAMLTLSSIYGWAQNPATLAKDGGWCWFQDERAIVDGDHILFGTVSSPGGDVRITQWNWKNGETKTAALHETFESDDHNVPALLKRNDGRYLAVYAKHGSDSKMRWRISANPNDASEWQAEQTMDVGAANTYSNVFRLSEEMGRLYNFHRGIGWNPNYMISDDDGGSWRYGGRLLQGQGRPYLKYASNNKDTIHFTATEQHPHVYDNSIYHGVIRNRTVYASDGARIAALSEAKDHGIAPEKLTCVYQGSKERVAWTIDMHLDGYGNPFIAFSVQMDENSLDHRYFYGRWDGAKWNVHEMAYAGTNLYEKQWDYTGLVALNPNDPNEAWISTDAHPKTGEPLISSADQKRHYEIFRGETPDGGKTWAWEAVTQNSSVDNLRPIIPIWDSPHTAVLWQRGNYRTYTDYDLDIVGFVQTK